MQLALHVELASRSFDGSLLGYWRQRSALIVQFLEALCSVRQATCKSKRCVIAIVNIRLRCIT